MAKRKRRLTNKRGSKYVDKLVQGTLARRLVKHWIYLVFAVSAICVMLTWIGAMMFNPMLPRHELWSLIWNRVAAITCVAVILVPIFIYDTIRLTHRAVGPMVRVRRTLENLANGRRSARLQFRPDDFWQEFAEELNTFCDVVEPHVCGERPKIGV